MANELKTTGTPGNSTATAVLIRSSDGFIWDTNAVAFAASPTAANMAITLTEAGSTGRFVGSIPAAALTAAASNDLKVEYADIVPGSFAYATAVSEREVITVDARGEVVASGSQPRQNTPAGRAFSRSVSNRADGTHKATAPVRVIAGTVGSLAVSLDMMPLFGADHVSTVGTPTVSPSGDITVTALGPRDTEAMVSIAGTSTASSTYVVTVPVTMDAGESVDVDFDVVTMAD